MYHIIKTVRCQDRAPIIYILFIDSSHYAASPQAIQKIHNFRAENPENRLNLWEIYDKISKKYRLFKAKSRDAPASANRKAGELPAGKGTSVWNLNLLGLSNSSSQIPCCASRRSSP